MIPLTGPGSWGRETGTVLDRTILAWKEALVNDNLRGVRDGLEADFFRDYRIVSTGRTLARICVASTKTAEASRRLTRWMPPPPGQRTMERNHFAAGGAGRGRDVPCGKYCSRLCFWMILQVLCGWVTGGPIGNLYAMLGRKMRCSEI